MADYGSIGMSVDMDIVKSSVDYDYSSNSKTIKGSLVNLIVGGGSIIYCEPRNVYMTNEKSATYTNDINTYFISGFTKENGVDVSRKVRVFARNNGVLLGEVMSGGDGLFSITIVARNDQITAIAYDDDDNESYNAVVYDKIIPA